MTHDLYLQVQEVNIVEGPKTISRNFVPFAFLVAQSSTCSVSTALLWFNLLRSLGQKQIPVVRLWYGTGRVEAPRDYGAERGAIVRSWCGAELGYLQSNITVRNEARSLAVRLWYGTRDVLAGDITVRNGVVDLIQSSKKISEAGLEVVFGDDGDT